MTSQEIKSALVRAVLLREAFVAAHIERYQVTRSDAINAWDLYVSCIIKKNLSALPRRVAN